jgi:hypothetical protein
MTKVYFFDSYALIELLKGNKKYQEYLDAGIVITKLNLFEVYYFFLRERGEKEANEFINQYYEVAVNYDNFAIIQAAKLKFKHKKRKISMTDCIGYQVAEYWGIKFLTGDKEFEKFENVEFVK